VLNPKLDQAANIDKRDSSLLLIPSVFGSILCKAGKTNEDTDVAVTHCRYESFESITVDLALPTLNLDLYAWACGAKLIRVSDNVDAAILTGGGDTQDT
jgi:hypothetical protein